MKKLATLAVVTALLVGTSAAVVEAHPHHRGGHRHHGHHGYHHRYQRPYGPSVVVVHPPVPFYHPPVVVTRYRPYPPVYPYYGGGCEGDIARGIGMIVGAAIDLDNRPHHRRHHGRR